MEENIETMLNILETKIEIIKDKIRWNNLCLRGSINNLRDMKDKEKKQRIINCLIYLSNSAEHYAKYIKGE